MRRFVVCLTLAGAALVAPGPAQAVEGCITTNPGPGVEPVGVVKCSYTATVTGSIGASGTWKITVVTPAPRAKPGQKKGKPTTKVYEGSSPAPVQMLDVIKPGDQVTAEALAPGTIAAVGYPGP